MSRPFSSTVKTLLMSEVWLTCSVNGQKTAIIGILMLYCIILQLKK